MKWNSEALDKYVQAKEYVDTILLPLIPFQFGDDEVSSKTAFQNEVINIFSNEIERELSGRIMVAPNYYYLKDATDEKDRINAWIEDMQKQPFEHIILLTFDANWKKVEKDLQGTVLWLPAVQSGDINSKEMQSMLRDQISQVSDMIRSFW
ncbi:YpiF family protein [Oceanobacillus sp. CAU 1775]